MLHKSDRGNAFDDSAPVGQLEYVTNSPGAMTSLAKNYVGLPIRMIIVSVRLAALVSALPSYPITHRHSALITSSDSGLRGTRT
jgi:hypothetical protein